MPTALISVSDKTGVVELARKLHALGYALLSTGGTAKLLAQAKLPVTEVADHTGFPEMLDGRVKTLHPHVHGGLLARRDVPEHIAALKAHEIATIDVLVVNLYPFEATVAKPGCTLDDAIENIDIGGPAMVRSAAKNWQDVAVLTDASQYAGVIEELERGPSAAPGRSEAADTPPRGAASASERGGSSAAPGRSEAADAPPRGAASASERGGSLSRATRFALAVAAFNRIARYDAAISDYLSSRDAQGARAEYPAQANGTFVKLQDLRYGENPHQTAAFYRDLHPAPGSLVTATQLQGKELSYNNIADADAAWECVKGFDAGIDGSTCVIVKHANPCGVALGADAAQAYAKAFQTDPTSAFGGIIAFNTCVDEACAKAVAKQFVEVLIAPDFTPDALAIFATKANARVLRIALPAGGTTPWSQGRNAQDTKRVGSGLLIQTADTRNVRLDELKVVTKKAPTDAQLGDLLFAWRVAKYVKSNAIVFAGGGMTLGVGAGQMSRVDSARIASIKAHNAKLSLQGSAVASDAFFPFRDGLDVVVDAGAACVIQPGGSVRDPEVIAAADERGVAMVFTGVRHFRH